MRVSLLKQNIKTMNKRCVMAIIVGMFIIFQLLVIAFYMNKKSFFFIDEMFCYEGAHNAMLYQYTNSSYPYRLEHGLNSYYRWITSDEFMEHFEVRGNEKIIAHSLNDIKQNLKSEHIYYIMLNIIMSFQPNPAFTKWSGYALNALIFIVHQIVLYCIGKRVFHDKKRAILPMILYGFSAGGITATVFIRFYLLMSLLYLFMIYAHINLLEKKNIKNVFVTLGVTAVAMLCLWRRQPYMVLCAATAAFVFCVVCFIKKEYKLLLLYISVGTLGGVIALIASPGILVSLQSMAQVDIGVATINNFIGRPFKEYVEYMIFYFMKALSHVTAGIYGIAFAVVLLFIAWFVQGKKKINSAKVGYFNTETWYVIGVVVCYFLINARIQEAKEYRYMICIYPGLCVGIAVVLEWMMESCKLRHRKIIFSGIVVIGLIIPYWKGYVDELYPETVSIKECLAEHEGEDNLFIKPKDQEVRYYQDGFMIFTATKDARLYLMNPDDVEVADYSFVENARGDGMICWIPIEWEEDMEQRTRVLDTVLVHTKFDEYIKLFETDQTYGSSVYYMY